jgi:hypothetical protein
MAKSSKVTGGMNGAGILITIVSVIAIFVIVYYIYTYYFSGVNTLASGSLNLNSQPPPPPILVSTLTNPESTKYAYGLWVNVNTWDTTKTKVIFSRYSDIILYLDKTTGVLNCAIGAAGTPFYTPAPNPDSTLIPDFLSSDFKKTPNLIFVTNNFPLQTWVYIVVNVNNTVVDIYLNGKMVKSAQINQTAPDKVSNIFYGNGYDAVVNKFTRWSTPVDPNTVWNYYTSGNGSNGITGALGGAYSAQVTVSKNNAVTSQFKLF